MPGFIPPPPPETRDEDLSGQIAAITTRQAAVHGALADVVKRCNELRLRHLASSSAETCARLACRARRTLDALMIPRLFVPPVLATIFVTVSFIGFDVLTGWRTGATLVAAASGIVTLVASIVMLVAPDDSILKHWSERAAAARGRLDSQWTAAHEERTSLEATAAEVDRSLDAAQARWSRVVNSREHVSRQLLAEPWRDLRGYEFEAYLSRVLQNLGYEVTQHGGSGDQGVDLLAVKNGGRIAIQAKGYGGSVGNSAIQEAYTGSAVHRCHACAVVTNSRFTSGAIEAAEHTGCILVHGDNFAEFVSGSLQLLAATEGDAGTT